MPMEFQYLIVYLEVLVICLVFLAVIFLCVKPDFGSDWEVSLFKGLLGTLFIALIVDGITHAHYRGAIQVPRYTLGFCYATYMFFMSGMLPVLWLMFAETKLKVPIFQKKYLLLLAIIPTLIIGFMAYSSIKTGWFFIIDENSLYHRGPFWVHQNIVAYIYFMITTIHSLAKAFKEKSPQQRKEYFIIAAFVTCPIFGALLQLFIGSHPFVAPSAVIAMFFIFINLQGNAVSHDTLTGINNRKNSEEYLNTMLNQSGRERPFYVFMMDIDGFKGINDTYGHIEGDRALAIFANLLKECVSDYHGYVARWGGDEFIAVIEEKYIDDPDEFIVVVNETSKRRSLEQGLPYTMHCCYGYTLCDNPHEKKTSIVERADAELYRAKLSRDKAE